jgi:pilus assembly protein CpaB
VIVRIFLFTLILTGLAGFGGIAYIMFANQSTATAAAAALPAPSKRAVVTVNKSLKPSSLLKPEDLGSIELTLDKVPDGAVTDGDDVKRSLVGGLVRHALSANDVLRLPEDALRPTDHGFRAAVLAPGTRAVTVGVDTVSGAAGLIWPGDRVDVILTQTIDDQGVAPGRRVAAETMLQDVRVIAIDQQITQGTGDQATVAKTVTLEVKPDKVEVVQVGAKLGRLSLSLRSADAGSFVPMPQKTVWAGDVSAALPQQVAKPTPPAAVHVFQGSSDGKEYRF